MRIVSALFPLLGRALPGQAAGEPSDGALKLNPNLLLSIVGARPIARHVGNAAVGNFQDTVFVNDVRAINAVLNSDLVVLTEGVWRIDWNHRIVPTGAVADLTALASFLLFSTNLANGVDISVFPASLSPTTVSGTFPLTVHKDNPMTFRHATTAGAGTGTVQSRLTVLCSRLL